MSHVSYTFASDKAELTFGTASPYLEDVAYLCVTVGDLSSTYHFKSAAEIEAVAQMLVNVARCVRES